MWQLLNSLPGSEKTIKNSKAYSENCLLNATQTIKKISLGKNKKRSYWNPVQNLISSMIGNVWMPFTKHDFESNLSRKKFKSSFVYNTRIFLSKNKKKKKKKTRQKRFKSSHK